MSYKRHVIVEMPKEKGNYIDGKLVTEIVKGQFSYMLFKLKIPGILNDDAVFVKYFKTEQEALVGSPEGTEIIRWERYRNMKK